MSRLKKRASGWLTVVSFGALALAVALSAGCAAPQQDGDTTTAQASGDDDGDEDDGKVCRVERPTGSNIARRVCEDPSDATDRRERDQERMRESQQRERGPQ